MATTMSPLLPPDLWPDLADPFEIDRTFMPPIEVVPYAPLFTRHCGNTPVRMTFDGWDLWFVLADLCNAVDTTMNADHWAGALHRVRRWTPDLERDRLRTLSLPGGRLLTLVSSPGVAEAMESLTEFGAEMSCEPEWTRLFTFVEEQTRLAPHSAVQLAQCHGHQIRVRYDGVQGQHWFALNDVLAAAGVELSCDKGQPSDRTSDRWELEAYLYDRSTSTLHDGCGCYGSAGIVRDVQDGKQVDMITRTGIAATFHHLYVAGLYRSPVDTPFISDLWISSWADGLDSARFSPYGPREDEEPPYGFISLEWPQGYGIGVPTPRQPSTLEQQLREFFTYREPEFAEDDPLLGASPVERSFWQAHQALELPSIAGLVREYELFGGRYRLDFALPHLKIGIEIDGWEYHGQNRDQFAKDRKRWRDIERDGWRLVRYSGREIHQDAYACVRDAAAYVAQLGSPKAGAQ